MRLTSLFILVYSGMTFIYYDKKRALLNFKVKTFIDL